MKKITNQPLTGLSVCFDLDGTVVDTAPDLVRVTNEVIAGRGHGPVNYRKARKISLGADLSICTNKPGWLARPLLRKLDLDSYFTRIVGGDEPSQKKPSPEHIFESAGHRDSSRIIMVGDSWPDMRAALNANVHAILMTYGYSPVSQIRLRAGTRLSRFRDIVPTLCNRYT